MSGNTGSLPTSPRTVKRSRAHSDCHNMKQIAAKREAFRKRSTTMETLQHVETGHSLDAQNDRKELKSEDSQCSSDETSEKLKNYDEKVQSDPKTHLSLGGLPYLTQGSPANCAPTSVSPRLLRRPMVKPLTIH